ncbi:MAG TPA: tRNA preQ1(34) S-adenosylmethionine ribosyltransferase-isomerase QueA [Acidobacteriota bacterium]
MKVSDLDYHLPAELIAQAPLPDRSASRLLVVSRRAGRFEDRLFRDLPWLIGPSDFLVLNDSRVFAARLLGKRETGGQIEVLLLRPADVAPRSETTDPVGGDSKDKFENNMCSRMVWEALVRPKRKMRLHSHLVFSPDLTGSVLEKSEGEKALIEFRFQGDFHAILERTGHVPLPPYIRRPDSAEDRERYQTIYAKAPGSIAAPTAGLHFTPAMLEQLKSRGIEYFMITLHVGYGTFRPVKTEDVEDHRIDPESFEISLAMADGIRRALSAGRRLIAVGTTTTRVLEHWKRRSTVLEPRCGETNLFIYPPFEFQMVQGLLTNFHLPRSSLFALVCAFLGTDLAHACYRHAVQNRYRFYSYGDCMLIL